MMDHREHVIPARTMSEGKPRRRYVAYYRVSTGQQGQFGFSIEAQRAAVEDYVAINPGVIVAEFSEVMSGRKDSRPELAKALSLCRGPAPCLLSRGLTVFPAMSRWSRGLWRAALNLSPQTFPRPIGSRSTFSLRSPSTSRALPRSG
jgi:Resolvase, N terminal domain